MFHKYYWWQWARPIGLYYKGFGFSIWKWSGVFFPTWHVWFGGMNYYIGYCVMDQGVGFSIHIGSFAFELPAKK